MVAVKRLHRYRLVVWHGHSANQINRFVSIRSPSSRGPFGTILTTHSWELDALHRTLVDSGKGFRKPIVHRLRARPWTTLDPVGSISLAYCYVLMTLLQFVSAYRSTLLCRPPINSNSLPLSALLTVLLCRPLPIHRVLFHGQRSLYWMPASLRALEQCVLCGIIC
jgi:hypothetical protein